MTSKRYLGNIITDTPTPPTNGFADTPANGVWTLADVRTYEAAGLWPNLKNGTAQYVYNVGDEQSDRGRFNLNSLGNETTFGTMTDTSARFEGVCSSNTRGIVAGGSNTILYWTLATDGATADFGDRTVSENCKSTSNNTRGINFSEGSNTIDYVTIASTGNASDFGDQTVTRANGQQDRSASTTRAICTGGWLSGGTTNVIDYVTISTTGNATDFGNLTQARGYNATSADGTRAVCAAGLASPSPTTYTNVIDYVTIASTGNATDFGDYTAAQRVTTAAAGTTRGLYLAGDAGNSPFDPKACYYITIQTLGNTADFGDLTRQSGYTRFGSCSNATVAVQPS